MIKTDNMKKKYVPYYRVSTEKQGKSGLGLEAQKAIIKHFIKEDEIVKEFTEVVSGKIKDRKELTKAIEFCKKNGYTLAVAKIDRLSRKTEHALFYFEELDQRLFSCDIPTNLDKFVLTLFMAIADREAELISIRTKQALASKKAQGITLGKPENLTHEGREKGWEAIRTKAAENPNNKRAALLICEYKKQGMTLQDISEKMNDGGFKTSTGGKFHKTSVSRIYKRYCLQKGKLSDANIN